VSGAPLPRRAVRRMRPYRPPLEGRRQGLRLDFNENTLGPPPGVLEALAALDADAVAMYPEYAPARARLARLFGASPRELVLTAGTDEAIHLAVDTFADAGDAVLVVEPTYAMYRFYAERAGARVRAVRYTRDLRFPVAAVLAALGRRPRLLFLASPNNPTGTVIAPEELRRVLRAARSTLVFVDEAYAEFSGASALGWIRRYPNLVVTRTFSKARGLAGLRLGCLFANARLAAALGRAHSPYSVSTAALVAAVAAAGDRGATRRYVAETARARTLLEAALDRLGIRRFPSGGNFVLVDVGRRATALVAGLARRGILVRDRRADFGRAGYVRITTGTVAQTRRLVGALEELWRAA
jgi:histidinol-phosphate aminotransferase